MQYEYCICNCMNQVVGPPERVICFVLFCSAARNDFGFGIRKKKKKQDI